MTTTQKTSEGAPRNKKITVRVTAEEFAEIRRRAYAAGRDLGPEVYEWIRPRLRQEGLQ